MPTRQGYGTPGRAQARCHSATARVVCALQNNGFNAIPVRFSSYKGSLRRAHRRWKQFADSKRCLVHYMAYCNGFYIDMTARQFDSTAPYPAIYTEAEVAKQWRGMLREGWLFESIGGQLKKLEQTYTL